MSSTTSSDCESCDCSQCTYSFENNHNDYGKLLLNSRHVPMYAAMAHPLVYYAEIQQPQNKRQTCDQPGKDNPFKKAFKWYTQERTLCNKTDVVPEKCGFANWLDNKYAEYLRESGHQMKAPMSCEPRAPKTCTTESCPPRPGTTKKYGFKSPWRKRRRTGNDSGDVPGKCPDESCEYLLKPKELTRAASEPSYHTPTSEDKSNSTMASTNMPYNTKCSGRSHSLSDVAREKSPLKHGDTVPHAVQECPYCQEKIPTKLATTSYVCHLEQCALKEQHATNQPKSLCDCPQGQVVKVLSKEQDPTNQHRRLQEEILKVVKILSQEQDPFNLPKPVQEEVPKVVKVLSKEQDPTNQHRRLQEEILKVVKILSQEQDPFNLPKPLQEEVPKVVKVLSKEQDPTNQQRRLQEEISKVVKVLSKEQDPINQQRQLEEEIPKLVKVLSKEQDPTNQQSRLKEEISKVVKVLLKEQDPTNQQRRLQEEIPKLVKVLSKEQDPTNQPNPIQEAVPKVVKVPSKTQFPTNQLGLCCKCNLEKVPKVVQVPSQSRAVDEVCQYPEEKVVPVNEETQYEPAPTPPYSPQNLGPCCCKTCNKPIPPPPQMLCIPVKVQSNKITNPEICLSITPAQNDGPKKQKAKRLSVSCQSGEGNKSKVDTQSEHQPELSACCKATAASPNNCHEVNQVFGPIPIRRQSYSTVAINDETGEYSIVKEVTVVNKFTRSVTCASNDAAQTSDHSIRFETEPCSCQYPLFVKIICADTSKNE